MFIKEISLDSVGKEIEIQWRIIHSRSSGKIAFVEIRDWSWFLQCVIEQKVIWEKLFEELISCGVESAIRISWKVSKHPKKDEFELQTDKIEIIKKTQDYPLGQKEHWPEFLFDNRHLFLRSKKQRAIQRIRDTIIHATYDRMRNNFFTKIDSPIFTPNACEGTTDLYEVEHVNWEKMFLSQSGQLYIEAAIMSHGRVFDFGPVFRAEKSKTRRHLNEFWMMDAEMAFIEQEENMKIQEELVYFIIQEVLKKNKTELEILERDTKPLENIKLPFKRLKHDDRVKELIEMGFPVQVWDDIGSDIEMQYCEKVDQPVFLTHFPIWIKAFYTKEDPNNPWYWLCSDLLAPEWCWEVIWGSQREEDYDVLLKKIKEHNLPTEYFDWYLDIRKYGWVPHSGFGYGLERLVRRICNLHHIRETIPFPRYANRITP